VSTTKGSIAPDGAIAMSAVLPLPPVGAIAKSFTVGVVIGGAAVEEHAVRSAPATTTTEAPPRTLCMFASAVTD
jgi:hypothetical protein